MQRLALSALSVILTLSACTNGGGGDDDGGGGHEQGPIVTDCGIVYQGALQNPAWEDEAVLVGVEPAGSNLVIITVSGGRVLVKLHGLDPAPDELVPGAMATLRELTAGGQALYFQAAPDCTTTTQGGGIAQVGQLVTLDGRSYSEELIRSGFAAVEYSDVCGGSLIGRCYDDLADTSPQIEGVISNFLWKPISDVGGTLAILFNPYAERVIVNGETLMNSGGGNGRATTARSSKQGCAYGTNVKIRAYTPGGGILLFPGGQVEYTLPNGCVRTEF